MPLTVTTTSKTEGTFVVSPVGSLNSDTYTILESELESILSESPLNLVFNLEGVDYISSVGVRVIISTMKTLREDGGKVHLSNLQPTVLKVFEIINALPSLSVFKSTAEMDEYLDAMQKKVQGTPIINPADKYSSHAA